MDPRDYLGNEVVPRRKEKGVRPDGRYGSSLTEEDERRILRVHRVYCGIPSNAAKGLPYSVSSIKRVWESHGLKINSLRRRR